MQCQLCGGTLDKALDIRVVEADEGHFVITGVIPHVVCDPCLDTDVGLASALLEIQADAIEPFIEDLKDVVSKHIYT